MSTRFDVAIVGGGPAGLATALAARRHGLDVIVLDRRRPPIDKPCGEGLMPDGVDALSRLGVEIGECGRPFPGITWLDESSRVDGSFPGSPGLGLRRLVLHQRLVEVAAEAGVELRWGRRVEGLDEDGVRLGDRTVAARWVVGADGLRSRVRTWTGLARRAPARPARFGVRRHYGVEPWNDRVEVWFAPGAEAYVTPIGDDEVGVAVLWTGSRGGFDAQLERFPDLAKRLAGHARRSRDLGAGPLWQRAGAVSGRVALVGDAAGYVDAITGEGLAVAFREAEALGIALASGQLGRYRRERARIRRRPEQLTRLLVRVAARPGWRRRLLATLADRPDLFDRLLAVHTGAETFASLGIDGAIRLAGTALARRLPASAERA